MSRQITTATSGVVDTLLRWCGRTRVGVAILVVSLAGFVWVTAHDAQALRMTDFEVYVQGSSRLFAGDLYTRLYSDDHLPFTYPPFGALLLLPLALLPLTVGKIIWLGLSIVALWVAVRRVIEWAGLGAYQQAAGGLALSVTGLALWLQPVRSTLLYGQVNLILMAVLVVGLSSARPLVAGLSVGLTAGVKLIPAANVLYLAVANRYRAVAVAILNFWRRWPWGRLPASVKPGTTSPTWSSIRRARGISGARATSPSVGLSRASSAQTGCRSGWSLPRS